MSNNNSTGIRSNRNPILSAFRRQVTPWPDETVMERTNLASYWADRVTEPRVDEPSMTWLMDGTVSQTVDAARVLYRYAGVFA